MLSRTFRVIASAAFTSAPLALSAQSIADKVQIHGYLTQGYAASDSLPILGIQNKGTADYRAAAVQLRVAATAKDFAVVQLANRRMGASGMNDIGSAVELQWAYYQRRLGAGFSAKAGRSPMARGIFNEVRKVGTVLPFYRAPYSFYTESYETVDGLALSNDAAFGRWELETNVFGGRTGFRQSGHQTAYAPVFAMTANGPVMSGLKPAGDTTINIDTYGTQTLGGQLWLSTPIEGLRVGAGGTRFKLDAYQQFTGQNGPGTASVVQAAVDGSFTRFQIRSEWQQFRVREFLYTAQYVQAGVKVTERLSLNAQREQSNIHVAARPIVAGVPESALPRSRSASRNGLDHAIGVNWAFMPTVILKAEGHQNVGSNFDRPGLAKDTKGRYLIASVALSY